MPSLNNVVLLGTLPRDPAFKHTPRGAALCTFDLTLPEVAEKESGTRREPACTMRVVVWGRQAEACWDSLTVGSSVLVEGHLRLDVREDREGQKQRWLKHLWVRLQALTAAAARLRDLADEARRGPTGGGPNSQPHPHSPLGSVDSSTSTRTTIPVHSPCSQIALSRAASRREPI